MQLMDKHSNYSHVLNILVEDSVCEEERNIILLSIFNLLNDKVLLQSFDGTVSLKWSVRNESELHRYYMDTMKVFSDECVLRGTKSALKDIRHSISQYKFKVMITRNLCMM